MSTIGRYQIKRELGRGGMATVYLAFDPRFDREVAIKVLPREFLHDAMFRSRFEREAKLIAALEDPAIVPVYDFGEEAGQPYLVMRYMAGGSLSDRLQRGPLSLGETANLLARIAPALDKAHRSGVIHRDLKPANILFDRDGNPYIADFGIAKLLESSASFTSTGVIGTPAYMSPEHVEGERALDGRSDVYALGIIVYELLVGKPPYDADTPMSVALMHLRLPVPHVREAVPGLPAAVDQVVATALAKDREQRYPTAGALAAALSRAADSSVSSTRIAPPPQRAEAKPPTPLPYAPRSPSPPARRSRWTVPLLALVGMLAVAVVVIVATLEGGSGYVQVTPTPTRTDTPATPLLATNTPTSPNDTPAPVAVANETPISATDTAVPTTYTPALPTALREDTPTSQSTLTPDNTPTPAPDAVVSATTVNLRAGPGTAYDRLGAYPQGTAVKVVGKDASGAWLQVKTPDGKTGWMTGSLLRADIALEQAVVVAAPPTPPSSATFTPVPGKTTVPDSLGSSPLVSPNGSRVVVISSDRSELRIYPFGDWSNPTAVCKPYTLGGSVPPFHERELVYGPGHWSPDGSMIAVNGNSPGGAAIYICRVSDGSVSVFGIDADKRGSSNYLVEWSESDGFIYFWSASGANQGKFYSLYKALPDGGTPIVVKTCPEALPGQNAQIC